MLLLNDTQGCIEFTQYLWETVQDITYLTSVRFSFGLIYFTIFFCGVCGNSLVIISIVRNRRLQTVRNLFILNLSFSDLIVCLSSLPISAYGFMFKNWYFGVTLCYLIPLFQGTSIIISTFTLASIAIDRYILIVTPQNQAISKSKVLAMISIIWLLATGVTLPHVINYRLVDGSFYSVEQIFCGEFCDEVGWHSYEARQFYGACILVVQLGIPLFVITVCYTRIILVVQQSIHRQLRNQPIGSSRAAKAARQWRLVRLRKRQKANHMHILMVVLFAASWSPLVLLNILHDYVVIPDFDQKQVYLVSMCAHCIAMTSVIWNPILYAFMNQTLRSAFLKCLPFLKHANSAEQPNKMSAVLNMSKQLTGMAERTSAVVIQLIRKKHEEKNENSRLLDAGSDNA